MDVITATALSTKTVSLDGTNVLWEDNDEIKLYTRIFNQSTNKYDAGYCAYRTTLASPSASATFVKDETDAKEPDNSSGKYFAVYLKGAVVQAQSRDYYTHLAVNKAQTVKNGGDFASAILYATSDGPEFTFRHSTAYLKFTVDQNSTSFKKLTVSPVEESEYIVSRHLVSFTDGVAVASVLTMNGSSPYTQSSKAVSVTTDDDADFAPGTYYMAINPGTYTDGLKLTFENASGKATSLNTPNNVVIGAGKVANIGTIGTLEFRTPLQLATVFTENDKNQGVVYWVKPDNPFKGKAISASTPEPIQWSESLLWTAKIESQAEGLANRTQFNNSETYTNQKDKYYALKYCEDLRDSLGGNWYLPANDELRLVYQAYYGMSALPSTNSTDYRTSTEGAMTTKAKYDTALGLLGETTTATLDGDADRDGESDNSGFGDANGVTYWLSKVNTGGAVQYLRFGIYYNGNNGKDMTIKYYVRCIRDVEVQ